MWISFTSEGRFAVKIYVGGVNAVSGGPTTEINQTQARRYQLLNEQKSIQDYIVTPNQLYIDGIASTDVTVRQFVAMPLGSGYSVEAQLTGADLIGGLQVDITPVKWNYSFVHPLRIPVMPKPAGTPHFAIIVKTLTGKSITFQVSELHLVFELKCLIRDKEGIFTDQKHLIYKGKVLEDDRLVSDYSIIEGSVVSLVLRLRGGYMAPEPERGIAAGGLIKRTILRDHNYPDAWDQDCGTIFNVQILNSTMFKAVTGKEPPCTLVTAKTYAEYGFPYYDIYDEKPSGIKGDIAGIKSVAEKDLEGTATIEKAKSVAEVIEDTKNPVVMLDAKGRYSGFRPVQTMGRELVEKFGKLSSR